MFKTLTIVLGLAAFAGACKTDAPDTSASEKSNTTSTTPNTGGPKPRSGKIDLPQPRTGPQLPTDDPDDDRGATRQSREERRAQRMAQIDTDGDGEVSDAEREAARAKREADLKARLDTNKDGIVSDEERGAMRHQRAVDMHARFDKDGDGKVTQAEMESTPFARFNANADTNGDGAITVEELDTAMKDRGQRGPWRRGGQRGGRGTEPIE